MSESIGRFELLRQILDNLVLRLGQPKFGRVSHADLVATEKRRVTHLEATLDDEWWFSLVADLACHPGMSCEETLTVSIVASSAKMRDGASDILTNIIGENDPHHRVFTIATTPRIGQLATEISVFGVR